MLPQLHAGIAEVAAAKARMFINKPDGSKLLQQYVCGLRARENCCYFPVFYWYLVHMFSI